MCRHLIDPAADRLDHVALLTGHGLDRNLCCVSCDRAAAEGEPVEALEVCEGCVARIAEDEQDSLTAWRGRPGIEERPEPIDTTLKHTELPAWVAAPVDFAALGDNRGSQWLLLTRSAELVRFDADTGVTAVSAQIDLAAEEERALGKRPRRHLHVSADGRFAAVVNDYGRHGVVIELETGRVTMRLDRGSYHREQTPFPAAFLTIDDRTVLAHATDWNRLDLSDPFTGALRTSRQPTAWRRGEERPEHHLDYFHGGLHASPSGQWLADDGWVWSPFGVPTVWDAHGWLNDNPWESEDGPTRRRLCQRAYRWDAPMCWIADDVLAISGVGPDKEVMLDGLRVFNAGNGDEINTFAGPRGALFADTRRLYAATPDGLEIWDPFTGQRTGAIPRFIPTRHHRDNGELAAAQDTTLLRWETR
jgi:hypothetical protein